MMDFSKILVTFTLGVNCWEVEIYLHIIEVWVTLISNRHS